jgi:tight adherence protein B
LVAAAAMMIYRDYTGNRSIDQRLDRLTGSRTPTLEASGILREQMFQEEAKSFFESLIPRSFNIQKLFEQADFKMAPANFWVLTAIIGVAGAAIPVILKWPLWTAVILALVVAPIPLLYVFWLRNKRLAKFGAQLCEALELVARALRAGHSLAAAMQTVHQEMPEPISKEFGRVYDEQNLGLSVEQAMRNLGDRIPNLDLKFFVTAVIIQRQTGGDLAEILDKIGYVIRERFKIMGMVKALTGEGRASGVVLISLPFGLLFLMMYIDPNYVSLLWTHPVGKTMSVIGLILMAIGAMVIRKIINIKI